MGLRRNLLWIDGLAAAVAGVVVLALAGWLSPWYGLPHAFVLFLGWMNLAYATFSLSLARRSERPLRLLVLLAVANLGWGVCCLRWAVVFGQTASLFGLVHLVGEGFFVAGLGCLEWRWRELLRTAR